MTMPTIRKKKNDKARCMHSRTQCLSAFDIRAQHLNLISNTGTPGPCHKAPTFEHAPWLTFKESVNDEDPCTPPPPPPPSTSTSPVEEKEKDHQIEYTRISEKVILTPPLSPSVMRARKNSSQRKRSHSSSRGDDQSFSIQSNVITRNDHRTLRESWRRLGRFSATHDYADESIFLEIVSPLIEQKIESKEDLKTLFHTICCNGTGTLSWQQVREAILTFTSSSALERRSLISKSVTSSEREKKKNKEDSDGDTQISNPQDLVGTWVRLRNEKRGVVRFVGNTTFAPGLWAGIELLYPEGRNCGVVDGERYFYCESNIGLSVELNYGIFVRPDSLRVLKDRNMNVSFSPSATSVASNNTEQHCVDGDVVSPSLLLRLQDILRTPQHRTSKKSLKSQFSEAVYFG